MNIESRKIVVDETSVVSSEWAIADSYDRQLAFLIAHGAGNDMHSPLLSHIHRSIGRQGYLCVKFNFPYKEEGRRMPDNRVRLLNTWRAVVRQVKSDPDLSPTKLVASGKSLGGRMASMVVSEGVTVHGLVFFGYPLHPARQPEKIRSSHFSEIDCPMLFIQGTRDPLCDLTLLRSEIIDQNPHLASLHIIEGADHSFKVPRKMQRTEQSVQEEIVSATVRWMASAVGAPI